MSGGVPFTWQFSELLFVHACQALTSLIAGVADLTLKLLAIGWLALPAG